MYAGSEWRDGYGVSATWGCARWTEPIIPVLEGGLEQALALAASMDSRGYGRRGTQSAGVRLVVAVAMLASLGLLGFGLLGLLGLGATLGLICLGAGMAAAAVGLGVAGRSASRTRFRVVPWGLGETVVLLTTAVLVAVDVAAASDGAAGVSVDVTDPGTWWPPAAPVWATLLVLAPAGVLWVRSRRPQARSAGAPRNAGASVGASAGGLR